MSILHCDGAWTVDALVRSPHPALEHAHGPCNADGVVLKSCLKVVEQFRGQGSI